MGVSGALDIGRRRERWTTHHRTSVGLGLALESVRRITDAQACTVVGSSDGSLSLLDDVGKLMSECVLVPSALSDDHVAARSVGTGSEFGCGLLCSAVGVETDVREVGI